MRCPAPRRGARAWAGWALALAALLAALALPDGGAAAGSGAPFIAPGAAHPLGTDDLGRDLLRELLRGLRTSLVVGLGVTALALVLGTAVGLAAGLGPAFADELLMRSADIVASLPTLVVAILVAAVFGGSLAALVLVLGLGRWPLVARQPGVAEAELEHGDHLVVVGCLPAGVVCVVPVH